MTKENVALLDRRIYAMSDVDRYLGLHPGTARRWIDGYTRGGCDYPPVVRQQRTNDESVSWGEFVEAQLLGQFRNAGISLQRLRPAVERLRDEFNTPYPLAAAKPLLEVSGRELVMRIQADVSLPGPLALVVVRSGQLELSTGVQRFVERAEYGPTQPAFVERLRAAKDSDVLIDPVRALGRPAIRSVPTEILAEGFRAGASATSLADLYELKLDQVEQALRFEMVQADALGA